MQLAPPIDFPTGAQATWAVPELATITFGSGGKVRCRFAFYLDEAAFLAGKEPMDSRPYEFDVGDAEAVLGAPLDLSGPLFALLAARLAADAG